MPAVLTERRVLEIWQDSLQHQTDLVTEENEPIKIVYPGRTNDDRGADLRDAVIATSQGMLKGDIEIHVKTSHWWTHRHDRDPAYNRVILHVVYRNDVKKAILLQNGFKVPTLALQNYIQTFNDRDVASVYSPVLPPLPCRNAVPRRNDGLLGRILDEAGEQWFLSRTAYFQELIAQYGAGQSLYQGIMTALGYAKNKEAMAELARQMPLRQLEASIADGLPDSECLAQYQSQLLGTAGLLPSQRGVHHKTESPVDAWVNKLENAWSAGGKTVHMSAGDWRFFKVRPGNYPVRRIAAISHLLLRYRKGGLLAGVASHFKGAVDDGGQSLEQALLVGSDSYWGRYLDFGRPIRGVIPALLGKERAADIIVNVLLPFMLARGLEESKVIYHDYHAPAENTLVKHMRQQLGIERHLVNTARRQQGLLYIYKTRCSQGRCHECPLG